MLEVEYAMALAKIICDEMPDKVRVLRFNGIRELMGIAEGYASQGMVQKPIEEMWHHKLPFILNATSKAVIKEILKPSTPNYNGAEFMAKSPYHSEGEELMLWSLTSLRGPLISSGFDRYMELFAKFFPDMAANI